MSQLVKKRFLLIATIVIGLAAIVNGYTVLSRFQLLFPVDLPLVESPPLFLLIYPESGQEVVLSAEPEDIVLEDTQGNWYVIPDWECGKICVVLYPYDFLQPGDFWDTASIQTSASLIVNFAQAEDISIIDEKLFDKSIFRDDVLVAETGGPYRICWSSPKEQGYMRVQFQFKDFSYQWWYKNVK